MKKLLVVLAILFVGILLAGMCIPASSTCGHAYPDTGSNRCCNNGSPNPGTDAGSSSGC